MMRSGCNTGLIPFVSYTDTCYPIIMYCLGLFVVVYSKMLFTNKYVYPVSSGDRYLRCCKISLLYVV